MIHWISLFFCFFSFLFEGQLAAKSLHAIVVADTLHEIRNITQTDLYRWQEEARAISKHTKMTLKEKVFCGSNFDMDLVKRYLRGLRVEKDDAVIFYFSGHGYRTMQKKSPWPFLTFEYYKPGLDTHWIANIIRHKKPQFALIMTDCCNNFMEHGMFGTENKNVVIKLKAARPNVSGYSHLFCNAKGCIVVSSCSEGQFSYGSVNGGLYTQCFFNSLSRELLEKKPSWKNLLQRANGLIRHIQRPICQVYTASG